MAGHREGLELRGEYSWNTEPLYLLKGSSTWAELNVPAQVVYGTELTTDVGQVRELMTLDSLAWNSGQSRLDIGISCQISPVGEDLTFNRLAIIRGGKAQGVYTADFNAAGNTITITSGVPEPWSIGDSLVVSSPNFTRYTVSNVSGSVLTVSEDITADATDVIIHDASGTIMFVYVFVQEATVFDASTVNLSIIGYSFAQ
jgi:hypothetical protein